MKHERFELRSYLVVGSNTYELDFILFYIYIYILPKLKLKL